MWSHLQGGYARYDFRKKESASCGEGDEEKEGGERLAKRFVLLGENFSDGSVVKAPPANTGDVSSIPGSGRSPGEGNGSTHQYSCLENSMDRGPWQAVVHRVAKTHTSDVGIKTIYPQ